MSTSTISAETASHFNRLTTLDRRVRELEGQLRTATEAAKVNADTVTREQRAWREANSELHAEKGHIAKELRELRESLANTVVELPGDRVATLEMILAFPGEFGARPFCGVDGHDINCEGHDS